MPALTISTNNNPMRSRSPSPNRPPISPITPTLSTTRLPNNVAASQRQGLTHTQPDQTGILPLPPQPLSFDANPDVLALKSAISILQMQRQKAIADMQSLDRVKAEAVQDPEGFMMDLRDGKINAPGGKGGDNDNGGDDEDDDEEDDDEEEDAGEGSSTQHPANRTRAWANIPQPQTVVRCPPINWSQYAVVGESLDKLHKEQLARPSQGTPAAIGPNGVYEFRGEGKQEKYIGVAAPYAPTQDRVGKKPRPKK